eukprot:TRINITY_DN14_c0_g1_i1.p1 TRINITY_DN14_c0_g1~~TRINITY_DN14_c0_g1_i1.p1  ORF type:complete len:177 (-),score=56.33 TRINITY_DN14_c0_g1_i1:56-586(-)
MPPKPDAGKKAIIYMKVKGAKPVAPGALAPKVGPLGMSPKMVGDRIVESTQDFKGIRCTVKISVQNRVATVKVLPTASTLIVKALNEPDRVGHKKGDPIYHDGDISFEDVIEVAKAIRWKSLSKTMTGTVKEVLGSCVSIGCTVNGEDARDVQQKIDDGEIEIEDYEGEAPEESSE